MHELLSSLLLVLTGLIAGFIDSIAGGGGLITLPAMALFVGPGAEAIGTNKIVGVTAALVALLVYARNGHLDFRKSILFAGTISLGSFTGSQVSPLLPLIAFKWLLIISSPLILFLVCKKEWWLKEIHPPLSDTQGVSSRSGAIIISGLLCGFYDGVWGPGGGTFMFLSLILVAKLPLLTALAASKLANTVSAGTALVGYSLGGHVHFREGLIMALGISVGAFFGARAASKSASRIVRPALGIVALLLLIRVLVSES